jgi:pimeloyl-ACP methyl ester carboxylesterase
MLKKLFDNFFCKFLVLILVIFGIGNSITSNAQNIDSNRLNRLYEATNYNTRQQDNNPNKYRIGDEFEVEGGKVWDNKTVRKGRIYFHPSVANQGLIEYNNSGNPRRSVWLLIHGWNTDSEVWGGQNGEVVNGQIVNMGQAIIDRDPQAVVVLLDWSEAARTGLELVNFLSPVNAASWIDTYSIKIAEILSGWGIRPQNLNIIGHSLGSIMGAQVSVRLNEFGLGLADYLIVMNPPAKFGSTDYTINNNGYKFETFAGKARLVRSFVQHNCIFDNVDLALTANESIVINQPDETDQTLKHGATTFVVRSLLTGKHIFGPLGRIFGLEDNQSKGFVREKLLPDLNKEFDVLIQVSGQRGSDNIQYLTIAQSPDRHLVFGTQNSNNITLPRKDMKYDVFTGGGNDVIDDLELFRSNDLIRIRDLNRF